jgi:hypothetical protein
MTVLTVPLPLVLASAAVKPSLRREAWAKACDMALELQDPLRGLLALRDIPPQFVIGLHHLAFGWAGADFAPVGKGSPAARSAGWRAALDGWLDFVSGLGPGDAPMAGSLVPLLGQLTTALLNRAGDVRVPVDYHVVVPAPARHWSEMSYEETAFSRLPWRLAPVDPGALRFDAPSRARRVALALAMRPDLLAGLAHYLPDRTSARLLLVEAVQLLKRAGR